MATQEIRRWFVGDADELLDEVVGSVQQRKRNMFSQELDKKKAVINSVG